MFYRRLGTAEYVIPDDWNEAIVLKLDRNGNGVIDAEIFDLKRRGGWDLSFRDEKFEA